MTSIKARAASITLSMDSAQTTARSYPPDPLPMASAQTADPSQLHLAFGHQEDPRDEPCLKGEHLTEDPLVVCVPNEPCAEGQHYDRLVGSCVQKRTDEEIVWEEPQSTGFGDVLSLVVWAALLFYLGRKLLRRWRRHHPAQTSNVVDPRRALRAGQVSGGDLGWGSKRTGFLVPRDALAHHIVMAGGTGSGKTNSAEALECGAATTYRPQIIHFDCKGSRDGMARFLALMRRTGYEQVRLFPVEAYDGWRGGSDPQRALLGRLVQVQEWSESYYAAGTKDLLQKVLSERVPSTSSEFVSQLDGLSASNGNAKLIAGAQARYRGFFNGLRRSLDGDWAFEDCDACYIQLEGFGLPSEAVALGRYLLEDLSHYLAERKPPQREVLLVLDEFSAISQGADAANLIERAREFGCGVILTTQSYAGLGAGAERVLDAARGALIVHSLANPEPFTQRAGTVMREMASLTAPARKTGFISGVVFGQNVDMPRTTTRLQEFPRIDPNEVRQLGRGEAFVVSGGRAQRVGFDRVGLDEDALSEARRLISRRSAFVASLETQAESQEPFVNLDF